MSNGGGAKLVFCNIPAREPESLLGFYSALLGGDAFVKNERSPIPQYQEALTYDGIDLTITQRQDTRDVTAAYWAVPDVDRMVDQLKQQGGEVATRMKMPNGGASVLMLDPEGNFVGLIQLVEDAHEYFQVGEFGAEIEDALKRRREQLRAAVEGQIARSRT
jgi:predicted enzyme related to lactoylglutathione lyase